MSRNETSGYSNYQQVIDAIKAEYVNARDLKRKATGKNRTAKNADSFKKRKESESKSLDSKLNSVKESLDRSLSGAISDLDKSKFGELKTKLSELQAKLAYIDSESKRFDQLNQIDPKKYPAKSNTEKQTFSVVRSLLAAAIKDAEGAIDAVYNGESYSSIVEATIPTMRYNNTEEEVNEYYDRLVRTYSQLFDKAQDAISNYTNELFPSIDEMKQHRSELIEMSQELSQFKSELATLLENEASQSEIDSKENEIEAQKEDMLNSVNNLKIIDTNTKAWIFGNFNSVSVFIDDLLDFQDEFSEFYQNNSNFLVNKPIPETLINVKANGLYYSLFEALGTSEFELVWEGLSDAKFDFLDNEVGMLNVNNKLKSLSSLFKTFGTYNNDYDGKVQSFQEGISGEQKDFFVRHSMDIHKSTDNYMSQKVTFDFNMNKIQEFMRLSENERSNHDYLAENLSRAKTDQLHADFELSKLSRGHHEGTEEQKQAFSDAINNLFKIEPKYLKFKSNVDKYGNEYSLFKGIFPDFYKSLDELTALYDEAQGIFDAAYEKHSNMEADLNAAYEYLQTLTEGEAEYVAALADYEAKVIERDAYIVNVYQPASDAMVAAYEYLQTLTEGEAGYQSLVVSTEETISANRDKLVIANIDQRTAQHNKAIAESTRDAAAAALSMAQYDKNDYLVNVEGDVNQTIVDGYDFTINESEATIAQSNATIANANATIAQAYSDIDESNDIISQAQVVLTNITEAHYIYLGAQADYDAKSIINTEKQNQYYSLKDALEASYNFLQTLTDEDEAYKAALADWTWKDNEVNESKVDVASAQQNLNTVEDSLRRVRINQVGQDINFPVYGEYLMDLKRSFDDAEKKSKYYAVELTKAQTKFKHYKAEMTFVESTPNEKREALKSQSDAEKSLSKLSSWEGILTSHTLYMETLSNRVIEVVNSVRQSAFFVKAGDTHYINELQTIHQYDAKRDDEAPVTDGSDKLLQEIKEFMDGKNLYADVKGESLNRAYRQQSLNDKIDFYSNCITALDQAYRRDGDRSGQFVILTSMKGDILRSITAHHGELDVTFQDTLAQILGWNRGMQQFNDVLIAYQIEDEVNNGNPIVPGGNGGGHGGGKS
jgi:hypothetical protein